MTYTHNKESGFTLVELAIVMIIIGLLIGGILKGQELIANAQTTATIAQIKGLDGAISTFDDKYSALPGDMLAPNTRLTGCTAAPCTDAGDGNGRITSGAASAAATPATAPGLTSEGLVAFTHMAAADLIAGIEDISTANAVFGGNLMESEIGGGYWIGHNSGGTVGAGLPANSARNGHYLVLAELVGNIAAATAAGNSPVQAGQIDRKIDDGNPLTGDVFAAGLNCTTGAGATGAYNENTDNAYCNSFIRVRG